MKLRIGVMGSALERGEAEIPVKGKKLAFAVGKAIAKNNCIFLNGACGGLPELAAKGARSANGFLIGISPAENLHEHVHKYNFPTKEFDVIFYTGFGFKGRKVVNVNNCDAVIIVSGNMGTLNEFSIAYDEGMVIGIMQGSGGIADVVDEIIRIANKKTGAIVVYDTNPEKLVKKVIKALVKKHTEEHKLLTTERKHKACFRCR